MTKTEEAGSNNRELKRFMYCQLVDQLLCSSVFERFHGWRRHGYLTAPGAPLQEGEGGGDLAAEVRRQLVTEEKRHVMRTSPPPSTIQTVTN